MNRTTPASPQAALFAEWLQYLQRRSHVLLQRYDHQLFRGQFRLFYSQSTLPTIPLLQYYDSYLRIVFHKTNFFDIIERINRQLKTQSSQVFTLEKPTRGDPDWQRTSARSSMKLRSAAIADRDSQHQHSMYVREKHLRRGCSLKYRQYYKNFEKDQTEEFLAPGTPPICDHA